jgi:hypothetical protein
MKTPLLLTAVAFFSTGFQAPKFQPRYNFFVAISCEIQAGVTPEQPLQFLLNPVDQTTALRQTGIDETELFTLTNAADETFLFFQSQDLKLVYPMDLKALKTTFGSTFSLAVTSPDNETEPMTYTEQKVIKTGRSKEICGYMAFQYRVTYKNGAAEIWVTDFQHPTQKLYDLFGVMLFPLPTTQFKGMEQPLIMEMAIKNKMEEPLVFRINKIESVLYSFSTKGFQIGQIEP